MIMTDIETTGIKPGCKIVSIGATSFYKTIDKTFYVKCLLATQPFENETSTMEWWNSQGKERRDNEFSGTVPIIEAIGQYLDFVAQDPYKIFWSKGSFDYPIIEHILSYYGFKIPWKYWKCYDYRTVAWLRPDILSLKKNTHSALDDAINQTYHLIDLLENIRIFKKG